MKKLKKFWLNRRTALISPDGEIFMAPFFEDGVPKGVHPLYISRSKSTAVVAVPEGWRALPVVYPGRVFAGRLVQRVKPGDDVVVLSDGGAQIHPVTQAGIVGRAGGVSIPIWEMVEGREVARHPSGLWVDRFNTLYAEGEDNPPPPEEEDDI